MKTVEDGNVTQYGSTVYIGILHSPHIRTFDILRFAGQNMSKINCAPNITSACLNYIAHFSMFFMLNSHT